MDVMRLVTLKGKRRLGVSDNTVEKTFRNCGSSIATDRDIPTEQP
jgi:hypothetical protein